ncbi:MAG: ubiquitin-like protein Pup [Micrococcales bacterium]|nr:ubiquitin-like protein Pup [Micrococcales bacterium]
MAGTEYLRPRRDDEPADEPDPAPAAPVVQGRDAEVDALLDQIDDVLERNAEQFVRGFVQKGGE